MANPQTHVRIPRALLLEARSAHPDTTDAELVRRALAEFLGKPASVAKVRQGRPPRTDRHERSEAAA